MDRGTLAPLGYLSDHETKVDLLNNEAIATTILRLIREKSDNPITIGVHGDWGAGKSSVLEMVEAGLEQDARTVCLKFNSWQFQGFEDAKIALIEGVVNGLIEKRSLIAKAADVVKTIRENIDVLKAAKIGSKLAFTLFTGLPAFGVGEVLDAIKDKIVETFTDPDERKAALEGVQELRKEGARVNKHNVPQEIAEFRKSFQDLIKRANVDRIIVLVDDLDRCLPETAIETLEAIRLFVFLDKTAFVVGADERMIEYAVGRHFPNLPKMEDSQGYARAYLEKLLQVPFRIPALGETETRIYVTLLLLGQALGEDSEKFGKLLELGRTALCTPWDGEGMKGSDIAEILGETDTATKNAWLTAERISPVLAAGTKGNPRQIKRFLNALGLRLAVADARRFGEAIEPTHLAKIMLAELYLPEGVFPQIAALVAGAPDGICPEIAEIEAFANEEQPTPQHHVTSTGSKGNAVGGDGKDDGQEGDPSNVPNSALADWTTRPEVINWARVKPNLGGVNLKPYLFVIKDRHNYLSGAVPLTSKLKDLVARLAGGEMNAASVSVTVKGLTASEVDAVFKELRAQVLSSKSFAAKPQALSGIVNLTQAHPGFQGRYVDLLGEIPMETLGPWAASGHNFLRDADATGKLQKVLNNWRTNGQLMLKRALEAPKAAPRKTGRT